MGDRLSTHQLPHFWFSQPERRRHGIALLVSKLLGDWRFTSDPWNNISYVEGGKPEPPGEGWLVYPGAEVGSDGFVPSMRLKWIRKSVEDFEYVEILKRLHRGDWALDLVKTVAADWVHWSQDPEAVESVRRQLGAEIDRISSSQKARSGLTPGKQR